MFYPNKGESMASRIFGFQRERLHILCVGAIFVLVTGCGEEEKIVEEIRSLKTMTLGEATAGQLRRFSGVVRAVDRSALAA